MRLLIEAHHPAHVHFFKHAVRAFLARGDDVLLLGRDRDVMRHLLAAYSFIPHRIVTRAGRNNRFPMEEMFRRQLTVASTIRSFRPDVVLSLMGSYTQSARLFRVPNVIFTDSEFQAFNHRIAHPFATRIYTPECFYKDLGPKQRRYRGYHELAFLHPSRFSPREEVLSLMGGAEAHAYLILRTSAWNTLHDVGEKGIGSLLDRFLEEAEPKIRVFIVPEGELPPRFADRRLEIPADYFHDALAFARLVVTEGASTASEAACLGVPSVFVNSTDRGYLNDQERRYGLVYNFRQAEPALAKTLQLLDAAPPRERLAEGRRQLVADHVDVTDFVVAEVDSLLRERA